MTDKLLILRAFSTLNQVRDAKVPELNLLPSFHELVEDLRARLAQPEREWQGLTDEEIMEMLDYGQYGRVPEYARNFANAIEAKLKEKNTWAK